jgi:hypothetical protein
MEARRHGENLYRNKRDQAQDHTIDSYLEKQVAADLPIQETPLRA